MKELAVLLSQHSLALSAYQLKGDLIFTVTNTDIDKYGNLYVNFKTDATCMPDWITLYLKPAISAINTKRNSILA